MKGGKKKRPRTGKSKEQKEKDAKEIEQLNTVESIEPSKSPINKKGGKVLNIFKKKKVKR